MPHHHDTHILPYSPGQLFGLVADVERYPEFLPWCRAARILERGENTFLAELLVSFKGFSESYVSRVTLKPFEAIDVQLVRGPFRHLENRWRFMPVPERGTEVDFQLDFQFKSSLLEALIGGLFDKASRKMTDAFGARAQALYGSGKAPT